MIQIYDTKTKKKEVFEPLVKGKVGMYVCGPTVYDVAHLGHGRSAVAFDVIRKYFEYRGFDVKFVSNYTDIDDKMINRAKEEGISVKELAEKIIPEYEADYGALGVAKPDLQPRATEHIDAVLEIIGKLEEGEYAYVIDGDGVYFDVDKFEKYGELSGQNLEELKMGARVEINKAKRNPYDFALWKFKKEGEPAWDSPWGEGRPGWHIECSAMSYKHLGRKFDVHGGGLDLQFPHHECEVAQSVCALGEGAFAKYWLHNGFINVNNEKMSKSLGNFSTLREIFEKYDPQVVRFMFLQTRYSNPINFSYELLEQSKAALKTLHNFVLDFRNDLICIGKATLQTNCGYDKNDEEQCALYDEFPYWIYTHAIEFNKCMDDNFNTSGGIGVIFSVVNSFEDRKKKNLHIPSEWVDEVWRFFEKIDKVLGVIFPTKKKTKQTIDSDVEDLIKKREEARENKDFKTSDRIRDELRDRGIELEDTADGTIWKKV